MQNEGAMGHMLYQLTCVTWCPHSRPHHTQGTSTYGLDACEVAQSAPRNSWLQRKEVEAAAAAQVGRGGGREEREGRGGGEVEAAAAAQVRGKGGEV